MSVVNVKAIIKCEIYTYNASQIIVASLCLFSLCFLCAFQEVDRTDEEGANHRSLRVLQRSQVYRRHK